MKNYNRDKIDKMLQPLMTMMQEEFPNNCKLIIEPHFARIVYNHEEMIFQSDEMKKPLGETFVGEGIKNFIQTMADVVNGLDTSDYCSYGERSDAKMDGKE